jgi:hypothetical protein
MCGVRNSVDKSVDGAVCPRVGVDGCSAKNRGRLDVVGIIAAAAADRGLGDICGETDRDDRHLVNHRDDLVVVVIRVEQADNFDGALRRGDWRANSGAQVEPLAFARRVHGGGRYKRRRLGLRARQMVDARATSRTRTMLGPDAG